MRTVILTLSLGAALLLTSCGRHGEGRKFRAYLYKQPERDGPICVFYSDAQWNAERNAQMFADMHAKTYGTPLIVRTTPYE
jgi:hypothetical protein